MESSQFEPLIRQGNDIQYSSKERDRTGRNGLLVAMFLLLVIAVSGAILLLVLDLQGDSVSNLPIAVNTWAFVNATRVAYGVMASGEGNSMDAIELGGNEMELNPALSSYSVGYGGSPNENGETTLDAMVMWAPTREVGAVGCLKRVKKAISVARKVMEETKHTLLVGDDATQFASEMGFTEENLTTNYSHGLWEKWIQNNHQPNYWKGNHTYNSSIEHFTEKLPTGHDTIGMIAIDSNGNMACGTTTNGLTFKIPGRVGDSPIMGAGAYCDNEVGAAAATGNGDIMMRFLPSYRAVENMRHGMSPKDAAEDSIKEIKRFYPDFSGALIAVNKKGTYSAAYSNVAGGFPYSVYDRTMSDVQVYWIKDEVNV